MTRIMYDSTDPRNVPADAAVVAYYPHAWGSDLSHIKAAVEVRIDNRGDHADDCHALDVERGAATVEIARQWVQSWHRLHPAGMHTGNGFIRLPIVYLSSSQVPALFAAMQGEVYDLWVAQWDGTENRLGHEFARQYVDHGPHGENYDMSIIFDDTWGLVPAVPVPAPVPAPVPHPASTIHGGILWPNPGDPTDVNFARVTSTDGGATWHV